MLESLRKGKGIVGLHKDEDETLVANTYDPDNSPKNEKSNKRRQKMKKEEKDESETKEIEDKTDKVQLINETPVKTPRKRKPKKDKSPEVKERQETVIEMEALLSDQQEEKSSEVTSPREKQKQKKKKKPKSPVDSDETKVVTVDADVHEQVEEDKPKDEEEQPPEETEPKTVVKKKKRKKKKEETVEEETPGPQEIEDDGRVLSIIIHRTDKLKNDFNILHPLVRVHVVDMNTGYYLAKQHKDRPVTSYYEIQNEQLIHILPIMTQPFDFKLHRSVLPVWEDLLVFNENFNYFVSEESNVILFFELLDFVSMNAAARKYNNVKNEGGWHRIAWAFLKVRGANNKINVDSKVRLQLYLPPTRYRAKPDMTELFQWWSGTTRVTYPSTLYVTLKGIKPPEDIEPAGRSMYAIQEEKGRMTFEDLKSMHWGTRTKDDSKRPMASWTRLLGQMCRIPNSVMKSLPAGRMGCYVLKFSHDGRSLACACQDKEGYPIKIYEIPSCTLRGEFSGHFGIIYDLSWSKNNTHLLSAASDGTARMWNVDDIGDKSDRLLPHPGFVYCAQFHPRVSSIVVTGGYDQVIRVWDISGEDTHGSLMQEIEDHHGHINSLCFGDDGDKMYSADSVGVLCIWNVFVTDQTSRRAFLRDWTLYQEIKDIELKNIPINHIVMHPSGRRLLLHSRDNMMRMLDLRIQKVMQKYIGAVNFREKIRSTVTPCGSFVFSGSEDNYCYVWNTDTGDQVARYSDLNFQQPVTDVDYHPRDHIVAVCSLGENQPVLLYNYNPHIAQLHVGIAPDEITDVQPISMEEVPGRHSPVEQPPLSSRSYQLSKDEFEAQESLRYQHVMRKLDTATMQMTQVRGPAPSPTFGMTAGSTQIPGSVWGSTFDRSSSYQLTPRADNALPSTFSPHAPHSMSSRLQHEQYTAQNLYLKSGDSNWRPSFSDVGKRGPVVSPRQTYYGRPPQMSLSASLGKAQFSFQSSGGKPLHQKVVAMYNYRAQRSDELTFFKGDAIVVLYKDNENWWMGELQRDGQQGFFPATYVVAEDVLDDGGELVDVYSKSKERRKKKTVSAFKSKDGDLKFFSGTDESEDELLSIRRHAKAERDSKDSLLSDSGSETRTNKSRRKVRLGESNA
ncbi:jouberin-like [Gigantopelta aegis]|uniref:jouberin-like n=1 Tax=Gigantopelta aegis TaxID=1735272 RepID=UPI001B88E2B9|nr:jouberin-like [Gigantopelta aegis]